MTDNKQQSTFKKSVLSIVIVSAVTGGLIAFDKYQIQPQSLQSRNNNINNELLDTTQVKTGLQPLAAIAQPKPGGEEAIESALQHVENETPIEVQQKAAESEAKQVEATVYENSDKQVLIEDKVLFSFDSSEIAASYYSSLNKTVELMKAASAEPQIVWQVVGYADPTGNARYNRRLAKKRAQAVAEFLVDKGVNEEQLAIISLGDSHAQRQSDDKAQSYLQRRVEIHAYQAEIAALAEQLSAPGELQQALQTENSDVAEKSLSSETSVQQSLPKRLQETEEPLSTAMEF